MKNKKVFRVIAGILVPAIIAALFLNMILPVFLAICLFLVARMALVDLRIQSSSLAERNKRLFIQKLLHYFSVTLAGISAVCTLNNYWAAPERIFKNADHHALAHLGYQFGDTLTIVNQLWPESALWDKEPGRLHVTSGAAGRFNIIGERYYLPIYLRNAGEYILANAPVKEIFDSTFTIQFSEERRIMFSVEQINREPAYRYIYSDGDSTYNPVKINFPKVIRKGISLRDLLSKTPVSAPGFGEILDLMDSTYLIRQKYLVERNDKENISPLYLFPSNKLANAAVALQIDGVPVTLNTDFKFNISVNPDQSFFTGLRTKRVKTYFLRKTSQVTSAMYLGFPERKYLRSSTASQETLFLTTSANSIAKNTLLSGLLFDGPSRENNLNIVLANISYRTGPTTEKMRFRVVNEIQQDDLSNESIAKTIQAGDTLKLATAGIAARGGHDVYWIMSVTDLKASNGISWLLISGFILGFTVLALVSIHLTPLIKIDNSFKVEVAVYIILLAFLVVRTIIIWRAVTFVPLDDIAPVDFEKLRGLKYYFILQMVYSLAFFLIIITYKFFAFHTKITLKKWQWTETYIQSKWLPTLFLLYLFVFLKSISILERFASVLVPLAVYFLIDFVYQRRAVNEYGYATKSQEYLFFSKLNWMVALMAFALGDAGFGVIFIIFSFIYWYLRSLAFPDHRLKTQQPTNRIFLYIWPFRSFLIAFAMTAFIWYSPELLSYIFRHVIVSVQIIFLLILISVWFQPFLKGKPRKIITPVFFAAMLLVMAFQGKLQKLADGKSRMLFRAEVRFRTPDDIIEAEKYDLGNDVRLLNAAQNQWFINHFYDKGKIDLIHYFKLVPHFQQGSSYLTQISDLVSVRYVIAEHSEWVLISLIILLGLLTFMAVRNGMEFQSFSKLRAQLLCFLFALSFTIWLTASDRMVFVGQDFPLLSMNSLLTLVVSFGILLLVILMGYGRGNEKEISMSANIFEIRGSQRFIIWVIQLVIGFAFWSLILFNKNVNSFDLNQTISRLATTFEDLNKEFRNYQSNVVGLQSGKNNRKDPVDLMHDFDSYLKKEQKDIFKDKIFEKSVYDAFCNRYIQNNSPERLVHLKKNEEGQYEFAINNFYYNLNSPDVYQNTWQGNLKTSSLYRSVSINSLNDAGLTMRLDTTQLVPEMSRILVKKHFLNEKRNLNIRISYVPAGWMKDSLPAIIVGRTIGDEKQTRSGFVVKNGTSLLSSSQSRHAIVLLPDDVLYIQPMWLKGHKKNIISLKIGQKEEGYLAKNVWLNGQSRHFYPLQERSLWSYFFTNLVKSGYSLKPELWKKNIALTVDASLTSQIYDRMETYFSTIRNQKNKGNENIGKRGFSLVVLDSEGGIRTLSDYKADANMRINPNRMNDYKALLDELYLDTTDLSERMLFGNRCLIHMPNGPASTFKPILYGAVTSQYDLGWENLRFAGLGNYPKKASGSKGDIRISHFGGRPMKLTAGKNTFEDHDNIFYISQSTNTYNSMIAYLGSLTPQQLDGVAAGLKSGTPSGYLQIGQHPSDPLFDFPLLGYNKKVFRIDEMPDWDNKNSLISTGLADNFHFQVSDNTSWVDNRNLASGLNDSFFNTSKSSFKLWSFPESSHLMLIDRNVGMQNAIPQIAMGGYPIVVTPLKMAEMAAHLFAFNQNIQASVLADRTLVKAKGFMQGDNWNGQDRLLSFYSNNLFKGMYESVQSGTARFLQGASGNGYTFYAKTGTISGDRDTEMRDKNLMLIISLNPLHNRNLTFDQIKKNKFYVLYFSFYNDAVEGGWSTNAQKTIKDLIGYVEKSDGFKKFMRESK